MRLWQTVCVCAARSEILPESRAFLKLAVPLAAAQLAQYSVSFVDSIMMGRLGTTVLAAGGLASVTFQISLVTLSGLVMSVGVLAAESLGSGQRDDKAVQRNRTEQLARQGMWLTLVLTVPFMGLLWHMGSVFRGLQQPPEIIALAEPYLKIMAFGVFPALGFAMFRGYLSAFSLAGVISGIVAVGSLFNLAGNYLLGFGKLGFPRLELTGLAIASALSFWLMFGLFLAYLVGHGQLGQYRFWQRWYTIDLPLLRQLMAVGLPITITLILENGLFMTVTYLVGSFGTQALAAHQIAFQTMALIFMVPLGMSYAVTTRVGLWLGKRDLRGMRRAGYVAIAMAVAVLALISAVLIGYRGAIVDIFIDLKDPQNAAVLPLAMTLLLITALVQVLDGTQRVAMSALYGLQDSRVPMVLSAIAFWGIGLSSGYLLGFPLGFGVVGLWMGQSIGVLTAGIVFVSRFHRLTGSPLLMGSKPLDQVER